MIASIDPGQQLTTAYFILTIAVAFTIGLPFLLIKGSQITKQQLIALTPEELEYEAEIFGWLPE